MFKTDTGGTTIMLWHQQQSLVANLCNIPPLLHRHPQPVWSLGHYWQLQSPCFHSPTYGCPSCITSWPASCPQCCISCTEAKATHSHSEDANFWGINCWWICWIPTHLWVAQLMFPSPRRAVAEPGESGDRRECLEFPWHQKPQEAQPVGTCQCHTRLTYSC